MKEIYIIATAFLAVWAVSAANVDLARSISTYEIYTKCPYPQPNWWNTTTNIAHETDCTKFYKCHMGRPIEQYCTLMIVGDPVTRLHYNRLLEVCDWPWQAGCESCPEQFPNGTYPRSSKINDETSSCSNYYECINGKAYPKTCPPDTCFSRTCQECVKVDRRGGNCDRICEEGDKKSHDCNCFQYLECIDNDWFNNGGRCHGGLHFSPTEKKCLPANIAGCPYK